MAHGWPQEQAADLKSEPELDDLQAGPRGFRWTLEFLKVIPIGGERSTDPVHDPEFNDIQ